MPPYLQKKFKDKKLDVTFQNRWGTNAKSSQF
jgi:hypothetical protein